MSDAARALYADIVALIALVADVDVQAVLNGTITPPQGHRLLDVLDRMIAAYRREQN